MNPVEHHVTVDKGLKMKIKRKNVSGGGGAVSPGSNNKTESSKHEVIKSEGKGLLSSASLVGVTDSSMPPAAESINPVGGAPSSLDKLKVTLVQKEKTISRAPVTALVRGSHKRAHKDRIKDGHCHSVNMVATIPGSSNTTSSTTIANGVCNTNGSMLPASNVMVELNRISSTTCIKKETAADPYEFNAKVEDRIALPVKKVKVEKMENPPSPSPGTTAPTDMETNQPHRDVATETNNVSTSTDPDCLGPCEPGTSVVLEGIVWNETENGILVVNVTWRGKTYVGTLMDATKHAWAPPRLNCDSPANDEGTRTPRGRGKRGRTAVTPPVDMGERRLRKRRTNNNNPYAAPPSPAKSETTGVKRRGRPADLDLELENPRTTKRARTTKNGANVSTPENGFIECPEPNCMKKYRHINGLKYHQAHAHKTYDDDEDIKDDIKLEDKTPDEEKEAKVPCSPNGKGRCGRKASQADNSGDTKSKKSKKEEKDGQKSTDAGSDIDNKNEDTVSTAEALTSSSTESVVTSTAGTQSTAATLSTPATPDKPKKSKGEKSEKKSKHKVSTSLPQAQISIAASPMQAGVGLKPIQPKPTVLGETNATNPLVGLKEKKAKKKKNKDKDKEKEKKSSEKSEHKSKESKLDISVIKPNESNSLSMGLGGSKPLEAMAKMGNPPDLQQQAPPVLPSEKLAVSPPELQKQPSPSKAENPAPSVDVASSVKGGTSVDVKATNDTSAQSPAYSDISDANDSGSNLEGDHNPVHSKKESVQDTASRDQAKATNGAGDRPPSQGYSGPAVYGGYFSPQSYNNSPNTSQVSKGNPKQPLQQKENEKLGKPSKTIVKTERKDESMKDVKDPENGPKSSPSPAQFRDYQERLMHAQQQMAQQYMGAYGFDMRALAANPELKAQYEWMWEQERARQSFIDPHRMSHGLDPKGRPMDLNAKAMDLSKQGKEASQDPRKLGEAKHKDGSNDDKREKHGDVQKHSEARALEGRGPPYPPDYERQQEEYRRYFMYQQQRLMEHKRIMEQQQSGKEMMDGRRGPYPLNGPANSPHGPANSPHGREVEPQHSGSRDSSMNRDQQRSTSRDSTQSHSNPKSQSASHSDNNSPFTKNSSRPISDMKSEKEKSKSGASSTSSSSSSLPASPAGRPKDSQAGTPNSYGQYYPQGYPGYNGHMPPYDPSHSMYPQNPVMGYVSAPGAFPPYAVQAHLARSGYPEVTKASAMSPGGKEGKALELLQQKAANYYNSHSPHAKVKDGPRLDKPTLPSPKDVDRPDSRSSNISQGKDKDKERKSPPTQRHVHTHHHTHLVGPAYSLYGPYGALMASPQGPAATPLPFTPK